MKVYHGSFTTIKNIDLNLCRPFKDFGRGFYVTKFKKQAELWAIRNGQKHGNDGFVTEFNFIDYAFENKEIKSIRFETYNEKWLDFIVLNRKSKNQAHDFDIIEGPVADDKIQTRINDYLNGEITKKTFLEELKWHEKTHQICFCTVFSLQFLEQEENEKLLSKFNHISEPIIEKLIIDFDFDELTAADKLFSSKTFSHIADTNTQNYLNPWIEMYKLLLEELNIKPNKNGD